VNDDGDAIYSFYIKHSDKGICWETASEEEATASRKARTAKTTDDLLRLLPMTGDISQDILFDAASKADIGINRARELLGELIDKERRVFVWHTPRPGTRPAKSYSRQEKRLI
jgi:hypothetical protein